MTPPNIVRNQSISNPNHHTDAYGVTFKFSSLLSLKFVFGIFLALICGSLSLHFTLIFGAFILFKGDAVRCCELLVKFQQFF